MKVSHQLAKKVSKLIVEVYGGWTPCCVEHIWRTVQKCLMYGFPIDEDVLLIGSCYPAG